MTSDEILTAVKVQTAEALGLEPGEIEDSHLLVTDLGAESIDFIDLTFRLEKYFQIDIPEGELFESRNAPVSQLTVKAVAEYIQNHLP